MAVFFSVISSGGNFFPSEMSSGIVCEQLSSELEYQRAQALMVSCDGRQSNV